MGVTDMKMNVRLVVACAIATCGLIVWLETNDSYGGGFGSIHAAASVIAPPDSNDSPDLASRLTAIRAALASRADEETAWRDYAHTMLTLERSTHDFEQRVAAGDARDDGAERGRHALLLSAAMSDLQSRLDPGQFSRANSLTEDLVGAVICKGLAEN
jgi:hypothetical protein